MWILKQPDKQIHEATLKWQFARESDGKILIRGFTRWVCVNLETGKASRMPKEFAESFDVDIEINE